MDIACLRRLVTDVIRRCLPILLIAGCASSAPSIASMIRTLPAPADGQPCRRAETPPRLPAPEEILDTDATLALIGAAPNGAGHVIFEVRYDTLGARVPVRVLESTIDGVDANALTPLVRPAAPDVAGEPGRGWGVLVRAVPDAIAVDRTETCLPVLLNRREIVNMLQARMRSTGSDFSGVRTAELDVHTDSTGAVIGLKLNETTGSTALDRIIAGLTGEMRFAPPLMNRRPIEVWSRIPIGIDFGPPDTLHLRPRR
ncbi:MAG TPA: hypothetical protein VFZ24_02790 [Longimicrobiales bacterium]